MASSILPASSGVFINADPSPLLTTFGTGHPMLKSIISAPRASTILAASASSSGTEPKSWMAVGRSASSICNMAKVFSFLYNSPLALTISDTVSPQPNLRQMTRYGRSLMPAIGANATGTSNSIFPILIIVTKPLVR